jgi:PIN domain nuclease of toxin-antitoxin system
VGHQQNLNLFLLDTHVWIWALEGEGRKLGRRTAALVDRGGPLDLLRVSPVSVFEIASLHAAGRIGLTPSVGKWFEAALEPLGIRLAPLSIEAAIDAGLTGQRFVPDPIDRLLIATARHMGATLVTRDRRILKYAEETSAVRVHDASR